jgi:hypothetical protein
MLPKMATARLSGTRGKAKEVCGSSAGFQRRACYRGLCLTSLPKIRNPINLGRDCGLHPYL